jgi:hypothetical protein
MHPGFFPREEKESVVFDSEDSRTHTAILTPHPEAMQPPIRRHSRSNDRAHISTSAPGAIPKLCAAGSSPVRRTTPQSVQAGRFPFSRDSPRDHDVRNVLHLMTETEFEIVDLPGVACNHD